MLELILEAGLIVKVVLFSLILASIASWAVIALKYRELRAAESDSEEFLEAYTERPLDAVYHVAKELPASPLSTVFATGYRELARLEKTQSPGRIQPEQVESVCKRLGWVQTAEGQRLERGLSFLATVGSIAPFVGLFGTVVGIMNAFRDIGASGQASLAVVAPGIAEALVATAVGLFAAIPAVIGYNYASARLTHLMERADVFREDYEDSLRRAAQAA
jgi:biopolymer transport protein TolQ